MVAPLHSPMVRELHESEVRLAAGVGVRPASGVASQCIRAMGATGTIARRSDCATELAVACPDDRSRRAIIQRREASS